MTPLGVLLAKKTVVEASSPLRVSIASAGLLAIAAVVAVLASTPNEREVTLEEARQAPTLRAAYVRRLASRAGRPEVVKAIQYVDPRDKQGLKGVMRKFDYTEDEIFHGTTGMTAVVEVGRRIPLMQLGTRPVPVTILVFSFAFERGTRFTTEDDLLSGLSHEYLHATKFYNQGRAGSLPFSAFATVTGELNVALIKNVGELDAFRMELNSQPNRISPGYRKDRMQQYMGEYATLWKREEGMDPSSMERLKVEFFEAWMLDHPSLRKEVRNGEETWYFEEAETLRRFTLSQTEIRLIKTRLAQQQ